MKQIVLVLGGAALGGFLGYLAFGWVYDQGFYALVLPGGLLGIGAGLARNRSVAVAILCGLCAIGLGLFTEWRFRPWRADESLGYFLVHVHELTPVTLGMVVLGGVLGFWFPYRRIEKAGWRG
jgi:hypothetical protein